MDYQRHYTSLIKKHGHKVKPSDGLYYERHHVLPKSLGGSHKPTNLRYLRGKAHLIAHHLLWRIHGDGSMGAAYFAMCAMDPAGRRHKVSARRFEEVRGIHARSMSIIMKGVPKPKGWGDIVRAAWTQDRADQITLNRSGLDNTQAKIADIYRVGYGVIQRQSKGLIMPKQGDFDVLIAENVCIAQWAKENGYARTELHKTARGDAPHHKGLFAVYK